MDDLDDFLREAVFYPCSELDGDPVKYLAKKFNRFFYVDCKFTREQFGVMCESPGFHGYQVTEFEDVPFELVFGAAWDQVQVAHRDLFIELPQTVEEPFIVKARFTRLPAFDEYHWPQQFELIFARCEAIVTFSEAFVRRGIAPRCLVSINPGPDEGGNYITFPQKLAAACQGNAGGWPEYLLCDSKHWSKDFLQAAGGVQNLGDENTSELNLYRRLQDQRQYAHLCTGSPEMIGELLSQ